MTDFVTLEIADAVATMRLNRPPVNALNSEVASQIAAAAQECDTRDDIRAVIIWGGEKAFVAGADIKEFVDMTPQDILRRGLILSAAVDQVARIGKPVIAAVTGFALGGGCELALAADLRVSADNAKWGQPEILLGIIPGAGGTQRLPRLIGPAKAKDLCFTGRMISGTEAAEIGLVDVAVPAEEVYATASKIAARLAMGPALALRATKRAIDEGLDMDLANGLQLEAHLFATVFATEDKTLGVDSFIANGPGKAEFVGN